MDRLVKTLDNVEDSEDDLANSNCHNKTTVYLIGDCSSGVPYFRSLQHGLEDVAKFTFNKRQYQLQMLASASKEAAVAMTKSTVLDIVSIGLKVNRFNPVKLVQIPTTNLTDYPSLH